MTIRIYNLLKELCAHATIYGIFMSDREYTYEEKNELQQFCAFSIINLPNNSFLSGIKKILFSDRFESNAYRYEVNKVLNAFDPDIIFCEQLFSGKYGLVDSRSIKVLSAVDAISLAAHRLSVGAENLIKETLWAHVARQRRFIERKLCSQYHLVTVVSPDDAAYLSRLTGASVKVIPNGTDIAFFSPDSMSSVRDAVVFSGNLNALPNFDAILYLIRELFPVLHRELPKLKLVLAGRGLDDKFVRTLPDYVEYRKDYADIRVALQDALLYLCPVIHGAGIKNTVLQAMAMGIPVAVTDLIARPIGIVNNQTGFVINREDAYSSNVLALLHKPDVISNVGQRGLLHVREHFSWAKIANEYISTFNRLMVSRRYQ